MSGLGIITKDSESKIDAAVIWVGNIKIKKIRDAVEFETIKNYVKEVKKKIKFISEDRLSITRPMDEAKKKILARYAVPLENFEDLEARCKDMLKDYDDFLEAKRLAIQQAAEDKAAKEREKQEAIAREQRKREDEAREKERALREKAENEANEAKKKDLEKKAARESKKAETAAGKAEVRETVAQDIAPAVASRPNITTGTGVSFRMKHTGTVENLAEFVKFCLDTNRLKYISINHTALNEDIQIMEGNCNVPGVVVNSEKITSIRTKGK